MPMSKPLKVSLFIIGAIAGLLVLALVALFVFVDANAHKPRLETAASAALGMQVGIAGRARLGLFPGLFITLNDVHVRNRGKDLVRAKQVRVGIALLPLLRDEVRIADVSLIRPSLAIERDADGKYSFEKAGATSATLPALDLESASLSGGSLVYTDAQSGERVEAEDCNAGVELGPLAGGRSVDAMKKLSFTAELGCREIRAKQYTVSALKVSASGRNGIFNVSRVTMGIFGGLGAGNMRADFSGASPAYELHWSLQQFRIEELLRTVVAATVRARHDGFFR